MFRSEHSNGHTTSHYQSTNYLSLMSNADTSSKPAGPILCEYEKIRAQNIKRNNAKLRSLGLISALEEKTSNANASGTVPVGNKRKRCYSAKVPPTEGSRKSLRLQGVGADLKPIQYSPRDDDEILKVRAARVKECRETRLLTAKTVAVAGAEAAAKENPTATYEHCLMRVKTMKDKGLANRVRILHKRQQKALFAFFSHLLYFTFFAIV